MLSPIFTPVILSEVAASLAKQPHSRRTSISGPGPPRTCFLVQVQVPEQQSQTNQRQRRPAEYHAHCPFAQVVLHRLLRLPGNEEGLFVLSPNDHVAVMSVMRFRILHAGPGQVILMPGKNE